MKRLTRKAKSGFTLIELMVVILILGLLAAAIGLTVSTVIKNNKNKLDAKTLSDFVDKLKLQVEESSIKVAIEGMDKEGISGSRELMVKLFNDNHIDLDTVKKLAGASGTALPSAEDYETAADLADDNIIFAGPEKGKLLVRMLKATDGGAKKFGVTYCYNGRYMEEYESTGCVLIFAGEKQAESLTASTFKTRWSKLSGEDDASEPNFEMPGDVFGKKPFQYVKDNADVIGEDE